MDRTVDALRRILLVEDEPDIQAIARLALEAIGRFEVHTCDDGAAALGAVREFRPDLVLLDVMMPGVDGPATLRLLRGDPEAAQLPVIFMTAKVSAQEAEHYRGLGALGVIGKPFDPMALPADIAALWRQRAPTPI